MKLLKAKMETMNPQQKGEAWPGLASALPAGLAARRPAGNRWGEKLV